MSHSNRPKRSNSGRNSPQRLSNINLNQEPSSSYLHTSLEYDLSNKIDKNLVRITKIAR